MATRSLPRLFPDGRTFTLGQRVSSNAYAAEQGVCRLGTLGTVVGFSHLSSCFRVRRDDHSTVITYAVAFWEAAPPVSPIQCDGYKVSHPPARAEGVPSSS